ncbi:putative phage tail protein [uncultured Selenomonas sp.]|uniref:putative phage tail protein n=1 Tax=uncultured Selenomonas sp. TaxID=159275 RepID=UPI0028F1054B|nr:putative phage tail protein [uncultured Selenomonas sp.]
MDKITRDVRIERYYPPVVAPSTEFKTLAAIENPEYKVLWEHLWRRFANTFIYEIDESGAARWEDMLRMIRGDNLPLTMRRQRILARINAMTPYSIRAFRSMLDAMFGAGVVVPSEVFAKYELWLDVARTHIFRANEVRRFARVIAPANMTIHISSTAPVEASFYFVGYVTQRRVISIDSGSDISYNVPDMGLGFAGIVKQSRHIVIRSK